jgi:metal-responsive CopG/Arc/MetJ family transcriptional regulator
MATEQQKVTVTLPKPLLERLNGVVPKRKRSLFISEAIAEHLELAEQNTALEQAAGVWSEVDHPDMRTDEDIDKWVKDLRQG